MKTKHQLKTFTLLCTLAGIFSGPAAAGLITNGGFESGFTAWTTVDQPASEGTFYIQTGTLSPVNGFPVPAAPEGLNAAMTDAGGPGAHALYQDFIVPTSVGTTVLGFSLFINNGADNFYNPNNLDSAIAALNQQARVDILSTSADPFDVNVLQNLFQTNPGDLLVSGYNPYTFDITALLQAHLGETLRLRFAETDNVLFFNLGVDNVSIESNQIPIPEPASLIMVLLGLGGLLKPNRRRS